MDVIKNINIGFSENINPSPIEAILGDIKTRHARLSLLGLNPDMDRNFTPRAYIKKPDGHNAYIDCIKASERREIVVYMPVSGQTIAAEGTAEYFIELRWDDGRILKSFKGTIEITNNGEYENAIESSDDFSALDSLLQQLQDAINRVDTLSAKHPIPGDNGNWFIWMDEQWVDTGKPWKGEKGEPGTGMDQETLDEINGSIANVFNIATDSQNRISVAESDISSIKDENTAKWVLLNSIDTRSNNNTTNIFNLQSELITVQATANTALETVQSIVIPTTIILADMELTENVASMDISKDIDDNSFSIDRNDRLIINIYTPRESTSSAAYYQIVSFNNDKSTFILSETDLYGTANGSNNQGLMLYTNSVYNIITNLDINYFADSLVGNLNVSQWNSAGVKANFNTTYIIYKRSAFEPITSIQFGYYNQLHYYIPGTKIKVEVIKNG